MKAIINGQEGGIIKYNLGEDSVWNIVILEDTGAVKDVSTDTPSVEVYASNLRETLLANKATTGGTAASGHVTVVLADDESSWVDLNPGASFPMFVKNVLSGGGIELSENSFLVTVI